MNSTEIIEFTLAVFMGLLLIAGVIIASLYKDILISINKKRAKLFRNQITYGLPINYGKSYKTFQYSSYLLMDHFNDRSVKPDALKKIFIRSCYALQSA